MSGTENGEKKTGIEALAELGRRALEKAKGGSGSGGSRTVLTDVGGGTAASPGPSGSSRTGGGASGRGTAASDRTRPMGQNDMGTLNLGGYLAAYGVKVSQVKAKGEEKQFCLEECIFDSNHRGNEASIFQSPNPPFLTYQCFHDSCRGNTWKMARRKLSGDESLARFMSNYDPGWKSAAVAARGSARPAVPAARAPTVPGKDGSGPGEDLVLADMEIAARESLAAAETELPEPEDMDYLQFCVLGKGNRITFVPMLMAKYLGGYLHPIRHTADIFWHYRGGVWRELEVSTIKNICARVMKDDAQPRRISDGISLLAAIVNIEEADWEVQGELINCLTGMVDARELKLLDHDPSYGSRSQVPCRYIPEETESEAPELWNKTLREIFPEPDGAGSDKINLLWQYMGYILLPDCRYETSLWLLGTGANGKGTITDTMQAVMGLDNCSNLQVSELKDPRFNLYHLQNKMLNISTETSERDPLATEIFKKLVSGERVSTERKYGAKFDFTPFVKFVIGLNDMPIIPDKTDGFGRRVQLIRCDQKFKEGANRDPDRKWKLLAEVDGIFTWAVEGLAALLMNNGFEQGAGIKRDTEAFLDGLNPIIEFWREECDFHEDYEVAAGKMFDRHKEWFKNNNQRAMSRNRFGNELLKVPGTAKRQDSSTRRMIYTGVRLRP